MIGCAGRTSVVITRDFPNGYLGSSQRGEMEFIHKVIACKLEIYSGFSSSGDGLSEMGVDLMNVERTHEGV